VRGNSRNRMLLAAALASSVAPVAAPVVAKAAVAAPVPALSTHWRDALTGREIVRISREADTVSLYFNQNSFTPRGDMMALSTPSGIASVRLSDWSLRLVVRDPAAKLLFVGRRTGRAYYSRTDKAGGTRIFAADLDSGKVRQVARIADGSVSTINADETLLAGTVADRAMSLQPGGEGTRPGETAFAATGPDGRPLSYADAKEVRLDQRLEARIPMRVFTIDLHSGKQRTVVASTDWLNHVQFSPTDPTFLMYCHEGPWHKVDRIWTVRTDGSDPRSVHSRTMNMEIAGHEFFSPDGRWIRYDLQTPRGEVFWLAGYEIATGRRQWLHVERNAWSVHYNQSPDGQTFSGDGGDATMVAHAPDAKYLYLMRPRSVPDVAGIHAANAAALIAPGALEVEKLVDLRGHDYKLEPNAVFTPDGQWLVFRSNLQGATHVYAVSLRQRPGRTPSE